MKLKWRIIIPVFILLLLQGILIVSKEIKDFSDNTKRTIDNVASLKYSTFNGHLSKYYERGDVFLDFVLNDNTTLEYFTQRDREALADHTREIYNNFKDKIAIAGGFKPGRSTDYVAVSLALTYGSNMVINLSNIDYVYNKDPRVKGAKKIKNITWSEFRKIVGNKWRPGIISPFDPVAAKLAQKNNLLVVVLNGKKLKNISNCLNKQRFTGTSIN